MSLNRQTVKDFSLESFFHSHPVFQVTELDKFLSQYRTGNRNTRKALLNYYKNQGRLVSIRRGLYAVVPKGADPAAYPVDPYIIAAKLTEDATLSHHTALEYHGKAYTVFNTLTYTSRERTIPLDFRSQTFTPVPVPGELIKHGQVDFGVIRRNRSGIEIRITSLERTLVDILNRPDLSGSWEEIWRSLESIEYLDIDSLNEYLNLLHNATIAAKVGYFLHQNKEPLMIDDKFIEELRRKRPNQPHYLSRSKRQQCHLVKEWNLMVPVEIISHTWSEVL
jgi:predicted transcriptional regulator of viral defense system